MNIKKTVGKIIESNKQTLKSIVRSKKIDQNKSIDYTNMFQTVHNNSAPCFVLSTGRCGTHLLTKLFSKHDAIDVYHEPIPELVYYSKYAFDNQKKKDEQIEVIFDSSRYDYIRDSFLLKHQFVETNNRITFFAPQIARLYPNSKFIHLVRDPYDFIKSGLGRGWYTGKNSHDEGRIESTSNEWTKYTNTQKIAWLWNETNSFIEEFKNFIPEERCITIRSEDLFGNVESAKSIFTFINQRPLSDSVIKKIIGKPTNVGVAKKISSSYFEKINPFLTLLNKYQYSVRTND